jgi:predicted O-methyltransferase YrrM
MNDSLGGRIAETVRSGRIWENGRQTGVRIAENGRQAGVRLAKGVNQGVRTGRFWGEDQEAATWQAVEDLFTEKLIGSDPALEAAEANSETEGLPPIQVSPTQGKLLTLLVRLAGARSILEIGTLGGYSAIWMARALPDDGRLITLEVNPHHAEVARTNLEHADLASRVEVRVGPAVESLAALAKEDRPPFDLVFIDADKQNNPAYFSSAVGLCRPGALIVVDNVVRDGGVADPTSVDPSVLGTRRLLEAIAHDHRVDATAIQTVGSRGYDGFLVAMVRQSDRADS